MEDGEMSLECIQIPALLLSRQLPDYPLRYCSYTEDGSVVVACAYSHTEVLAVDNGEVLASWPQGFPSVARTVDMHTATARIASIDDGGTIHIRDIASGLDAMVRSGNFVRYHRRQVCYSPDGRWLAVVSEEGLVEVWLVDNLNPVMQWRNLLPRATKVFFSPENRYIIAGNDQKQMRAWRVVTGDPVPALDEMLTGLIAFRSDGRQLVAVARTQGHIALSFWQWPERRFQGETISRHRIKESEHEDLIFSPNGHLLALLTASYIFFWDALIGVELGYITGFRGRPHRDSCAFSPDGTRFIAGDDLGTIRIWDSGNGELVVEIHGHSQAILSLTVNPAGTQFASGDARGELKVWELKHALDESPLNQESFRGHKRNKAFLR
jgi:WD40 repeat protein